MEIKSFIAKDGKKIVYKEWLPSGDVKIKGMLQISHGMAESTVRYEEFAQFIADNGFIVFADDHRGHGLTDGSSGYTDGDMFFDTLSDVAELSETYRKANPELKLVLFGHSYGSFLTQAYIERYSALADGFIVGGSAYMSGFQISSGRLVARLGCLFKKTDKPANTIAKLSFGAYNKKYKDGTIFISSIKEECDKYVACKDCNFVLSYGFYKSMFTAFKKLYAKKYRSGIDPLKPILMVSGQDDPVGGYGALTMKLFRFYRDVCKVKDVKLTLYNGVRHEYLNDVSRSASRNDILKFCERVSAQK